MASFRFQQAAALVESAMAGAARREILDDITVPDDFRRSLARLRDAMQAHVWRLGADKVFLAPMVHEYDRRTRREGFHALHDWDGVADRINDDIIPVDVLNYIADQRGDGEYNRLVLAILLDYYFFYLLALLSLRLWDDGDPDENLDTLNALVRELQGPNGSGQPFVGDAHTLLVIATSHYSLEDRSYDELLEKVRTLRADHRLAVALGHAPCLGCHLRFGFEATYGRDVVSMRNDNVADYPWLSFSVATLMDEFVRLDAQGADEMERAIVVEGLANGLTADPGAFVGAPPAFMAPYEAERASIRDRFAERRADLLDAFEALRPTSARYSPLAFFFNFSQNVLKGAVVDALLWAEPWPFTLNDLLTEFPHDKTSSARKEKLAMTLLGYARAHPNRIRGRLMPVIVYDVRVGHQAFSAALRKLAG
ncbi:MAG: hypothetical protein AB1635_01305 [Acidobacteriota bacterium]